MIKNANYGRKGIRIEFHSANAHKKLINAIDKHSYNVYTHDYNRNLLAKVSCVAFLLKWLQSKSKKKSNKPIQKNAFIGRQQPPHHCFSKLRKFKIVQLKKKKENRAV